MFGKRQYMKFRGEMEKKKAKIWGNWGQMRLYEKYGFFKKGLLTCESGTTSTNI